MIRLLTISLLLISAACGRFGDADKNVSNTSLKTDSISTPITQFLKATLPRYTVQDSLQLKSLQSTLYLVNDVYTFDDNSYVIIRDNISKRLFNIPISSWSTYNDILDSDLQLMILENESNGRSIKPVNYELIGLESFLNNCISLESRSLDPNVVDTIFKFYNEEFVRLTEPYQIDSIVDRNIAEHGAKDIRKYREIAERKRTLLKAKVEQKNVFVYDSYVSLYYAEINPGRNIYYFRSKGYHNLDDIDEDQIFFPLKPTGNNYCLIYSYIN